MTSTSTNSQQTSDLDEIGRIDPFDGFAWKCGACAFLGTSGASMRVHLEDMHADLLRAPVEIVCRIVEIEISEAFDVGARGLFPSRAKRDVTSSILTDGEAVAALMATRVLAAGIAWARADARADAYADLAIELERKLELARVDVRAELAIDPARKSEWHAGIRAQYDRVVEEFGRACELEAATMAELMRLARAARVEAMKADQGAYLNVTKEGTR